jgi:hypothetical protein
LKSICDHICDNVIPPRAWRFAFEAIKVKVGASVSNSALLQNAFDVSSPFLFKWIWEAALPFHRWRRKSEACCVEAWDIALRSPREIFQLDD